MLVHIGLDDTDSRLGGCTTYLASEIIRRLHNQDARFVDYPRLIRLNPNIPWKTKGNAAVSMSIEIHDAKDTFEEVCNIIEVNLSKGESDAAALLFTGRVTSDITELAKTALWRVIKKSKVIQMVESHRVMTKLWGNGRGVIGALAAIGSSLSTDHTFELLVYRNRENWGTKRKIVPESVFEMDRGTQPFTYNNYDPETERILIAPHGPDPVLLGIRGETPEVVLRGLRILRIQEPIDRYIIFRTNQGTGVHLTHKLDLNPPRAYVSGYVRGVVANRAKVERGGHLFLPLNDSSKEIQCAVYEPTGSFRRVFQELVQGDVVEIGGGVRRKTRNHPSVINVEYIQVLDLKKITRRMHFFCSRCGKRMKSIGRNKGYRCRHCGKKIYSNKVVEVPRKIGVGLYQPPPRAHRHLTKPFRRIGLEKQRWDGSVIDGWCWFSQP